MPADRDYAAPRHPAAFFSPTEGYFVAARGQGATLLRVTGRRAVTEGELPHDAFSLIPAEEEDEYSPHEVEVSDRWIAVQFDSRGPVLVLHDDGTVTERFTMPGDVAQLPLGGAA